MSADSEGTLRAQLLGKLLGAQAELEAQLAELHRTSADSSVTMEAATQLRTLVALQRSVSTAAPEILNSLKANVGASVSASFTVAQQTRQVASAAVGESAQLSAASNHLRDHVTGLRADLFDRRIFDRYLTFATPEEEEAYRRREAEARSYIDRQLAAKTPEGNLNAAGATVDRMLDAHAHGAGSSPEFLPRWNRLVTSTQKMREELRSEGRPTEEFDRNLRESVRRYLRSKGLSDAEIEARLTGTADPLEAVKPYLKTEQDAKTLDRVFGAQTVGLHEGVSSAPVTVIVRTDLVPEDAASVLAKQASRETGLTDVMARFQAAGIATTPDQTAAGHGIAESRSTTTNTPAIPRR